MLISRRTNESCFKNREKNCSVQTSQLVNNPSVGGLCDRYSNISQFDSACKPTTEAQTQTELAAASLMD